jgi:arginyl-tRNA--protein-N-Asp/Glu arginylyltransferase
VKANKKENPEQNIENKEDGYPPNHYKNYLIEYTPYDPPAGVEPVHKYTIEIHKAMFTEELYALYIRYEQFVHKKDQRKGSTKEISL